MAVRSWRSIRRPSASVMRLNCPRSAGRTRERHKAVPARATWSGSPGPPPVHGGSASIAASARRLKRPPDTSWPAPVPPASALTCRSDGSMTSPPAPGFSAVTARKPADPRSNRRKRRTGLTSAASGEEEGEPAHPVRSSHHKRHARHSARVVWLSSFPLDRDAVLPGCLDSEQNSETSANWLKPSAISRTKVLCPGISAVTVTGVRLISRSRYLLKGFHPAAAWISSRYEARWAMYHV